MSAASRANRLTPYLFLGPAAVILTFALLYPIGYMVYASFLDWSPSQRIGEADFIGLRNYTNLLQDAAFGESFWVTIKFAAVVVTLEMIIVLVWRCFWIAISGACPSCGRSLSYR